MLQVDFAIHPFFRRKKHPGDMGKAEIESFSNLLHVRLPENNLHYI